MSFQLPNFNLLANIWAVGDGPLEGAPGYPDVPCQLYVNSKAAFDTEYGTAWAWSPPTFLRLPVAFEAAWQNAGIIEITAHLGDFYIAKWKERIHMGFPNEYLAIQMDQSVDAHGTPGARNVTYPPL